MDGVSNNQPSIDAFIQQLGLPPPTDVTQQDVITGVGVKTVRAYGWSHKDTEGEDDRDNPAKNQPMFLIYVSDPYTNPNAIPGTIPPDSGTSFLVTGKNLDEAIKSVTTATTTTAVDNTKSTAQKLNWFAPNPCIAFYISMTSMQEIMKNNKYAATAIILKSMTLIWELTLAACDNIKGLAKVEQQRALTTAIVSGISAGVCALSLVASLSAMRGPSSGMKSKKSETTSPYGKEEPMLTSKSDSFAGKNQRISGNNSKIRDNNARIENKQSQIESNNKTIDKEYPKGATAKEIKQQNKQIDAKKKENETLNKDIAETKVENKQLEGKNTEIKESKNTYEYEKTTDPNSSSHFDGDKTTYDAKMEKNNEGVKENNKAAEQKK